MFLFYTLQQYCVVVCYNIGGDVMKSIGEKLRNIREEKGFPQKQVAEILGLQRPNYSKIENNSQNLTPNQLKLFCEFFNVSADYILDRKTKGHKIYPKTEYDRIIRQIDKLKDTITK